MSKFRVGDQVVVTEVLAMDDWNSVALHDDAVVTASDAIVPVAWIRLNKWHPEDPHRPMAMFDYQLMHKYTLPDNEDES